MKSEGTPIEAGPSSVCDAVSGEGQVEDRFSDDEQGTELEALQHLPLEERRRALRRLRNRESARRVRARRLAEMSQMENTVHNMQDENTALKAHVSKLQNHIQSMTMKVYEITSKYEAAVAENAQLRSELHRPSLPASLRTESGSFSGHMRGGSPGPTSATAAAAAAAAAASAAVHAQQTHSGAQHLSPFIAPSSGPCSQDAAAPAAATSQQLLAPSHSQLRCSSPADMQHQRHAIEEVVALLQEHKRRSQATAAVKDRSASELGSSGVGPNNTSSIVGGLSPNQDTPAPSAAAAAATPTGTSCYGGGWPGTGLTYAASEPVGGKVSGLRPMGLQPMDMSLSHTTSLCGLGIGGGGGGGSDLRASQSEILMSTCGPLLPPQSQQPMHMMQLGLSVCMDAMAASMQQQMAQPQQLQQLQLQQQLQAPGRQGPNTFLSSLLPPRPPLPPQQQAEQHKGTRPSLVSQNPQLLSQLQPFLGNVPLVSSNMQSSCSGALGSGPAGLSGSFFSAASNASALMHGGGSGCGALQMGRQSSCGGTAAVSGDASMGTGGSMGQLHNTRNNASTPFAFDRAELASCASAHNVVSVHPTWHSAYGGFASALGGAATTAGVLGGGGGGGGGVPMVQGNDITDDLFMSLDEYVPQDL